MSIRNELIKYKTQINGFGFKKHLNKYHPEESTEEYSNVLLRKKIKLHKDFSTAVSVDLENNVEIESRFTELEIVIENSMDYYDSCSSDEEDQYENNPRFT
ncbi:hypothetical protein F4703DRAFT_1798689 [Phycomyces blakesleeanus]